MLRSIGTKLLRVQHALLRGRLFDTILLTHNWAALRAYFVQIFNLRIYENQNDDVNKCGTFRNAFVTKN